MQTLADKYRARRPEYWDNFYDWCLFLFEVDPNSSLQTTDLGPVVTFSDGSIHRLGAFNKEGVRGTKS